MKFDQPVRILVVDDNDAGRYVKAKALRNAGYAVVEAGDGVGAVDIVLAEDVSLVVLDVHLPDILGFEVCGKLKSLRSSIPVLMTSATFVNGRDLSFGLDGGADAYLTEPIEEPVLLSQVRALLRIRAAEQRRRASEARYRTLIESTSTVTWSCPASGRFAEPQPEWMTFTGQTADEMLGEGWTKVLHPEDVAAVTVKWRHAVTQGSPFRNENRIRRHDGEWRWMRVEAVPVRSSDDNTLSWFGMHVDITERKQAEAERDRLAAIVASTSEAIISKTLDGVVTSWNEAAERIFGYSKDEMIGASIRRLIPADCQAQEDDLLARVARGERIRHFETVRLCKEGRRINVSVTISAVLDESGKIVGASTIAHDITEKKRAEERERLLMREVNHRSKNMLGLVQAIARQTAAASPEDFVERFAERVQALSASQDVLVESGWREVPIEALIRAQLSHFSDLIGLRIRLSGSPLKVTAAAAQALGMAVHELGTNAAKYGALSNDSGVVEVSWTVDNNGVAPRFTMSWVEHGGPKVTKPTRCGFGSMVTDNLVKLSCDGEVETDYAEAGHSWRLSCPTKKVVEDYRLEQKRPPPAPAHDASGHHKRILVVEDEPLIAMEIAAALKCAGFEVLGPAGSVDHALLLFEGTGCDAAILDVNLGDETAAPIAQRLVRSGVPFVTVSGYGRNQLPREFLSAPLIGKPLNLTIVVDRLKSCLERGHQTSLQ